jgi:hypothetical protein
MKAFLSCIAPNRRGYGAKKRQNMGAKDGFAANYNNPR